MSSKLPMVSLDKVEIKLTTKTRLVVAVDKVAAIAGMSRAAVINGYIEDGLKRSKVRLTLEDERRIAEIRMANVAKREANKAKKGIA